MVRYGAELGYEVTVVRDGAADYAEVEMRAALEVNVPNYATAILSAAEVNASITAGVPNL